MSCVNNIKFIWVFFKDRLRHLFFIPKNFEFSLSIYNNGKPKL